MAITFAAAIGTGLVIGLLQGIIVTAFRAPAFIVTLGVSLALQGVLLVILPTSGTISLISTDIAALSTTYLQAEHGWVGLAVALAAFAALRVRSLRGRARHGLPANAVSIVVLPVLAVAIAGGAMVTMMNSYRGVPLPIALLFLLLAALAYVTTQTRFGLYLFAIGANQEAARRAGIPVSRIRLAAFALAGALSALAGMRPPRASWPCRPIRPTTLLLEAVAAAVIGGASLRWTWIGVVRAHRRPRHGLHHQRHAVINADTYLRLMVRAPSWCWPWCWMRRSPAIANTARTSELPRNQQHGIPQEKTCARIVSRLSAWPLRWQLSAPPQMPSHSTFRSPTSPAPSTSCSRALASSATPSSTSRT